MLDGVRRIRLMLDTAGLPPVRSSARTERHRTARLVLVELNAVEQRYRVVLEVLEDVLPVTDVAMRHGPAGRPCTPGCGDTARRGWRDWSTAPGDRRGVRTLAQALIG